ncbi:sigma-70 family RNA polymerase sigma factor [Sphingopyxis alaskensis]|jgi:RNA polymerase sigma factor (sigma-70 family)|uniref:RNA polymerase, sigma-24 subunit, ECF subfamily n=1 Tax=Sphingopyxis alaskensis (strain DSM 13593 / LMG 18877 / RB2256) TaxID=317655 RepID=Q1GPN7_SPHAL|nr:sigma-70 family RNA polymerase sigma factor [Sphingopyxis alaskensis]ABF54385.1 RNA polymerase, sigma-24 subunit, ECF subfamily [Sphingopyxis alaskensis RB2256]MCM3417901.1 sigma-70 family RNA polymerase sigma factor [Sphingopyxis alaskensis]
MKSDEPSLARLMAMAQRGDRLAYRTLLIECRVWLRRYFGRKVAPNHLEDLVQDTLLSLHSKLATYDPSRPFLPWLAAIARYRWVDQLRRVYRAAEMELEEELIGSNDEPAIVARISLERLFAQLPSAQARAIELVKIEGLSVAEASLACGQSESLIKVNIHRGLKRLAAMIEKA